MDCAKRFFSGEPDERNSGHLYGVAASNIENFPAAIGHLADIEAFSPRCLAFR